MKNNFKFLFVFLLLGSGVSYAQSGDIGIGTTVPDASAALDITSTTKGLLIPRMTTTERDAIVLPANGLSIYNTTTNQLEFNSGTTVAPSWTAASVDNAWSKTGNAGTDGGLATNFIGTTDDQNVVIRANSPNLTTTNNVSNFVLGSSSNPYTLQVNRNIENIGSSTTQWRGFVSSITESTSNTSNHSRIIGSTITVNKQGTGNLSNFLQGLAVTANESSSSTGVVPTITGLGTVVIKAGTGATTTVEGFTSSITHSAGSGSVTNITGNQMSISALRDANNYTTVQGLNLIVSARNPSGSYTNMYGINLSSGVYSGSTASTTITNMRGVNNTIQLGSASTITNAYGYYGAYNLNSASLATVTNLYQLYLGANGSNHAGITNNWAIYTNLGLNSFGDNIEQRGTGYLKLATGTTAERPVTGTAGMTRFNTTLGAMEYFDGIDWSTVASTTTASKWTNDNVNSRVQLTNLSNGTAARTAGTEFVVNDNGNVGIKTALPRAELDVVGTGAIITPTGDTAQRPTTPVAGMIRFNSTTSKFEGYNGTAWVDLN